MTDFSARWKTTDATIKANEIIAALKANKDIREFFSQPSLYDKYSEEDKYFNDLLDLRGLTFSNEDFLNCDISYLNFNYCIFENCTFSHIDFRNNRVHETLFENCHFFSSNLDCIYGYNTAFKNCIIDKASLISCYLIDPSFINSTIENTDLHTARLISPVLNNSTIKSCDLSSIRIAPTISFIKQIKENRTSFNLRNIEWLSHNGKAIKNPLDDSLWKIKSMIKEMSPFK